MLSSLFESRNTKQGSSIKQAKPLFDLTTKKIEQTHNLSTKAPSPITYQNNSTNDKQKQIIQKQKPQCTIFVGNVALDTKHSQLQKLFSNYGKIQKVWFRSIPVQPTKMGRKAGIVLKKFIQNANSMNAYIRYQKKQDAQSACKQNGSIFKQLTLRVNMSQTKLQDTQTTVFVGNLSHDIKQQQLRDHFNSIGKIKFVRVVKSRQTNKGIGIGYVHFQDKQSMKQAIEKLNGTKLLGRDIRVKKAVEKERLEKKQKKLQVKFGKKYKNKNTQNKNYINKNSKAIQIRQKSKEIKQNRQQIKTKQIQK